MRIYKVDITGIEGEDESSLLGFYASKAEAEREIRQFLKEDFAEVKENGEERLDRAILDGLIDNPAESRRELAQLKPKKFEPNMIQCLEFKNTKADIIWLLKNHGGRLLDVI